MKTSDLPSGNLKGTCRLLYQVDDGQGPLGAGKRWSKQAEIDLWSLLRDVGRKLFLFEVRGTKI